MSQKISSFKDLRVYKLAFEVQQEIFATSKRFPVEERYALTDQIRRASRSIGANLAEAWQKRRYVAHFLKQIDERRRRAGRNATLARHSYGLQLLLRKRTRRLVAKCSRIGQMLGTMMAKPEKFF